MKKRIALMLAALLVLNLAACGKQQSGDTAGSTDAADGSEQVYVPEFIELEGGEGIDWNRVCFVGDDLYYMSYNWDMETKILLSMTLNRYTVLEGTTAGTAVFSLPEYTNMTDWTIGGDGSLYAVLAAWSWNETVGTSSTAYMLAKYDAQGNELFINDITDLLDSNSNGIAVDGEGRVYVLDPSSNSSIWLFDAEGNHAGRVDLSSGMGGCFKSFCRGADGRICAAVTANDGNGSSTVLCAIDFEKRQLESICSDFPSAEAFCQNAEGGFVLHDGISVYGYDMDSRKEKLFDWLDCAVTGACVIGIGALSNGCIVAAFQDLQSYDSGLVMINKVPADQVVPKQEIVLGMMGNSVDMDAAVARFNKRNDSYHVTVRDYIDHADLSDTAASDALTRLNLDIVSDNCPDIISLNRIQVQKLAAKGVFEDLAPYLERSGVDGSDLLENIIEAYTIDGKLICIPDSFLIRTTVGSAALVGEESGWTLEELIALADAHPVTELFDRMSKEGILKYCLAYNMDSFVDWETGSCYFDTDAFKRLLQFVSRFPDVDNHTGEEEKITTPERIVNGEVLLYPVQIGEFDVIQLYEAMFNGPVTCIGYPNTGGGSVSTLSAYGTYAIASKSNVKEGAWAFLESYLTRENTSGRVGFPNSNSELERMAAEAVYVEYVLDENGKPMLDEQGNPMVKPQSTSHGTEFGDWTYEYRVPTQEEVDMVLEQIKAAKLSAESNEPIMTIIGEEAAAFFQGQKSVDQVADAVQRRASIYVSENS